MAPAVLLPELSVDAEAGAPLACGAALSGSKLPRSPSPPAPPGEGICETAPGAILPPLPPLLPEGPLRALPRAFSSSGGTLPGSRPGGTAPARLGGTPPGLEPPLFFAVFGFGSRGGAAIGRWLPESGTRTSAVTQTGVASRLGSLRK